MTLAGQTVLIINPGADVYGSDLQMLESVTAARNEGARVVVACPNTGPLVALLASRGAEVKIGVFPVVRRSHLSPRGLLGLTVELAKTLPAMSGLVRRVRPTAIYVNTTTIPWWIAVARLHRIPVLCHVHEAEDKDRLAVLRALNSPLLLANRVILISNAAAQSVWVLFPRLRRKSVLVPNGVPDRANPPTPPPGDPRLVRLAVVGRLSPRKAPHTAIETLRLLVARGVGATLEIAGSVFPGYEWYEQRLRDDVDRHGLADRVTFTGYVSPSFVAFDRADIVLAPSIREPFGNAVVEAQLSQRPVIAAAAAGHLESIQDGVTGILVPVEDPASMAEAVVRLTGDAVLSDRLAHAARQSAVANFGIDRYRANIVQAIAGCVAATPRDAQG
jgi:glycosyltransferase involved in cell wall biosynthesis